MIKVSPEVLEDAGFGEIQTQSTRPIIKHCVIHPPDGSDEPSFDAYCFPDVITQMGYMLVFWYKDTEPSGFRADYIHYDFIETK